MAMLTAGLRSAAREEQSQRRGREVCADLAQWMRTLCAEPRVSVRGVDASFVIVTMFTPVLFVECKDDIIDRTYNTLHI